VQGLNTESQPQARETNAATPTASQGRPGEALPGQGRELRARVLWPVAVAASVVAGSLVPVLFFARYYFVGDTEAGAYGQWYQIGTRLLAWDWSVLNPTVWQSGVYLADGAWGIFSPVLWLVGLASHAVDDMLLFATLVKLVFLVVAALGAYGLARNYGALRPIAAAVAVALPLAGFTQFQDATSWVSGLMAWAFLPWAWWFLRRAILHGANILPGLVCGFLVIGIAYTHATAMLGLVMVSLLVESVVGGRRPVWARALLIGVLLALAVIIVHITAIETLPATSRATGIGNDGHYVGNLSALLQSAMPIGGTNMESTAGNIVRVPFMYISWMIPFFALVDWREFVTVMRARLSLPIYLLVCVVAVQLPSDLGPLRWPARLLPYLALAVLMTLAVSLSLARVRVIRARHLGGMLAILAAATYLTWSAAPQYLKYVVVMAVALAAVYVAFYLVAARKWTPGWLPRESSRLAWAGGLAILLSVFIVLPQHYVLEQPITTDHHLAAKLSQYRAMLAGSTGDVLAIGDTRDSAEPFTLTNQAAIGNAWYVTGKPVQNAYSTLGFQAYKSSICLGIKGVPCAKAFENLFQTMPETHTKLVDLMGISSILLQKPSFSDRSWATVPGGWHVVSDTKQTRLIVRDAQVPGAGGVVWTSPGTSVDVVHESAEDLQFRVTGVPAGGGTVALSRLPWPGYSVDGAQLRKTPLEGFLLSVDVPAGAEGKIVTVHYRSPGYVIMAGATGLLALLILAWGAARVFARRGGRLGWLLPETTRKKSSARSPEVE